MYWVVVKPSEIIRMLRRKRIFGYKIRIDLVRRGGRHAYWIVIRYPELDIDRGIPISQKWLEKGLPPKVVKEICFYIVHLLVRKGVISEEEASEKIDELYKWLMGYKLREPEWIS